MPTDRWRSESLRMAGCVQRSSVKPESERRIVAERWVGFRWEQGRTQQDNQQGDARQDHPSCASVIHIYRYGIFRLFASRYAFHHSLLSLSGFS
jgi:hypothetical protein